MAIMHDLGDDVEHAIDGSWTGERGLKSEPPPSTIRPTDDIPAPIRRSPHVVDASERGVAAPVIASILRAVERRYGSLVLHGDPNVAAVKAYEGPIVPGALADTLLEAIEKKTGDAAIGITLGLVLPVGSLGLLDYAFCSSGTLREALQRLARYHGMLTQQVKVVLEEVGERATLTYVRDLAGDPRPEAVRAMGPETKRAPRQWVEFGIAAAVTRMRHVLGEGFTLTHVSFAHEAPTDKTAHASFFGVPVLFGQAQDRVTFRRDALALPTTTGAPALARLIDERMIELEPHLAMEDVFLDRAHRTILELLDARECRLEVVAERMHLSRRTLQRELQRRGTSHTAILDRARRERAIRLLSETRVTVTDIAEHLGFAEPGAFFRAFRRWTGTSPKVFHDTLQGRR